MWGSMVILKKLLTKSPKYFQKQKAFNTEHHITPKGIQKEIPDLLKEFGEFETDKSPEEYSVDIIENVADVIVRLRKKMLQEAEALNFEEASRLRDKIKELERLELASDKAPMLKK